MSPARPRLAWAAFGLCCAIWGSTFLFIRIGNDTLAPLWAAGLRLTFASLLLTALTVARRAPWPTGAPLRAAIGFGIVDFGVSIPLLYWGEARVPSSLAAVVFATVPLATALGARLFGLERLRAPKLIASLVAIVGVALLFPAETAHGIAGDALTAVCLAALFAALAGVLLKRSPGAHPFAMNALAQGIGAVMCLAASAARHESWTMPHGTGWLSLGYLVVVGSVIAFATFAWLLQQWTVTRISFVAVITPIVALLLGWLVRAERLTASSLLGALVIVSAVVVANLSERAASRPPRDPAA